MYPLEGSTTTDHQVRGWTVTRTALAVLALMIASIGTAVAIVRSGDGGVPTSFAGIATDASTFRIHSVMTFETPDESFEISMDGWIDLRRRLVRMKATPPAFADGDFDGDIEMILTETHIYARGAPADLPPGKTWLRAPTPDEFGGGMSVHEAPTLIPIGPEVPPERFLPLLREISTSLEEVGRDDVRGVRTTHYRASVDIDRLLEVVGDDLEKMQRQWMRRMRQQVGRIIDIEIWLSGDGLPYRQEMAMAMGPGGGTMKIVIETYDYGRPVDIEIPPEDQIHDDPNAFDR